MNQGYVASMREDAFMIIVVFYCRHVYILHSSSVWDLKFETFNATIE